MVNKRKRRQKETAKEVDSFYTEEAVTGNLQALDDEKLFSIDTATVTTSRGPSKPDFGTKPKRQKQVVISKTETTLRERIKRRTPQPAKSDAPIHDIWADDTPTSSFSNRYKRHLDAKLNPKDAPRGTRHAASVAMPHPGSSVNPAFEDHQDAIGEAVAAAIARKDKAEAAREYQERREELDSDDLNDIPSSDEEAGDGDEGDGDEAEGTLIGLSTAPPVRVKRKTTLQRNTATRLRKEAAERAKLKAERRLIAELDTAKHVNRQLAKAEAEAEAEQAARAARLDELDRQPVLMRKGRIVQRAIVPEAQLTDQLRPTLRQTKLRSTATMMKDRFDTLAMKGQVMLGRQMTRGRARVKKLVLPKPTQEEKREEQKDLSKFLHVKTKKEQKAHDVAKRIARAKKARGRGRH